MANGYGSGGRTTSSSRQRSTRRMGSTRSRQNRTASRGNQQSRMRQNRNLIRRPSTSLTGRKFRASNRPPTDNSRNVIKNNLRTQRGEFVFKSSNTPYMGLYSELRDGTFVAGSSVLGEYKKVNPSSTIIKSTDSANYERRVATRQRAANVTRGKRYVASRNKARYTTNLERLNQVVRNMPPHQRMERSKQYTPDPSLSKNQNNNPVIRNFQSKETYYMPDGTPLPPQSSLHEHRDGTIMTGAVPVINGSYGTHGPESVVVTTRKPTQRGSMAPRTTRQTTTQPTTTTRPTTRSTTRSGGGSGRMGGGY